MKKDVIIDVIDIKNEDEEELKYALVAIERELKRRKLEQELRELSSKITVETIEQWFNDVARRDFSWDETLSPLMRQLAITGFVLTKNGQALL